MNDLMGSAPEASPVGLLSLVQHGEALDAEEFDSLRWAVPGVLPEGLGVLAGAPKAGKSWFVLGVLLALAQGGEALGVNVGESRPVLYLALEDGKRRLQSRCRLLLDGKPIPSGFHFVPRVRPDEVAPLVRAWLLHHGEEGSLIVVDTFGKVRSGSGSAESAYERDYRQAGHLKSVADDFPGVCVLLVHHTRQMPADDFVERVSGTNGLVGAADFVAVLDRPRQQRDGLLSVTGRDVTEGAYAVSLSDSGRWSLAGESLAEAQTIAMTAKVASGLGAPSVALLEELAKYPEGAAPNDIAAALGWDGDKAGRYLRRAAEAGRVVKIERGLYAPVRSVPVSESVEVGTFGHSDSSDAQKPTPPLCSGCQGPLSEENQWCVDAMHLASSTVLNHFPGAEVLADEFIA